MKRFLKYFKSNLGLFLLDVICAVLIAVCNLCYPLIARKAQTSVINGKPLNSIIIIFVILFVIFALKAVFTYIVNYFGHIFGIKVQGQMRKDLFSHLQTLPVEYFDENKTGSIMSRIVNDLFEVSELFHHGPEDLLVSVMSIIGAIVLICLINPFLCLIVSCVVPLIILVVVLSRKNMLKAMYEQRVKTAEINSRIENSIGGIRVSKIFTAEERENKRFNERNNELINARKVSMWYVSKFHTILTFIMDMLYLLALTSGIIFYFYGKISAPDLTAFILYIVMMINPIKQFQTLFEEIQNGLTGIKRFNEIMAIKPEQGFSNTLKISSIESVEFKNVYFKYPKTEKYVLKNFSYTFLKGKTVAIVGESGGGKTTLTSLILRFYDVESGEILVNGINVKDISLKSLRENVSVVQQDIFLFDGTIKENIEFSKENATNQEILDSVEKADLTKFISSLPDGLETEVGERGVKLSGGQKQKISIARAFLKNPNFLILDEATSSLDRFSEIEIQSSLECLSKGRTNVIIAHRLSTISNADEILVISGNELAERGTHEQLMDKKGIYFNLYTKSEK